MSRVVHFEIQASDPQKLIAFYSGLFGWTFEQWGNNDYWMITTGASDQPGINGGLLPRRGPVPARGQPVNAFVNTIGVGSVDETLATALSQGATLAVAKVPIPGVGWLAYITDPDGNILGLMEEDPQAR